MKALEGQVGAFYVIAQLCRLIVYRTSCEHSAWLLASTIVLICRHKMTCFMDFSVPKFLGVQNPERGEGHQLGGWRWPWHCDHITKLSRLPRRIIISIWRVFTKILPNNIIKETTKSLVERLQFRRLASSWDEGSLNNQNHHEHPWKMTSKEVWIWSAASQPNHNEVCCKSATSARGGLTASPGWACPNNSAQIGHKNWLARDITDWKVSWRSGEYSEYSEARSIGQRTNTTQPLHPLH